MAAFVPLALVTIGGVLCAVGERAMLDGRHTRAALTALPGVALVAMAVITMGIGLMP